MTSQNIETAAREAQLSGLFERYEPALKRYFGRKLSGGPDVDDLVQDVFARLARLDDLDSIDNPQAFIFRIAGNILRDRQRRALTHHQSSHEAFDDILHGIEDISAERVILGRQRVQKLKKAITTLPKKPAMVFLLNRFDGLTYGEIARHLGLSVSSVEKHMMTALAAIARKMDLE